MLDFKRGWHAARVLAFFYAPMKTRGTTITMFRFLGVLFFMRDIALALAGKPRDLFRYLVERLIFR
jgi:hypothetical protein